MSLLSWLRKRTSTRSRWGGFQIRPTTRRFRPQLEALEDRCVPSTLKVTNLLDSSPNNLIKGSLRYEIAQAKSNDTIVFANNLTGTLVLSGTELDIAKNLIIQGPGAGVVTISGNFYSRIFEVDGIYNKVTLSGLTIRSGDGFNASGPFGDPLIGNDFFNGEGGGIYNGGTLTISGCVLSGNRVSHDGGGIYNAGTLTVSGCTLSYDFASGASGGGSGGGIYNTGTLTVSDCTLSNNSAYDFGGGIYNDATLTVSNSTLSSNSATSFYGGGIQRRHGDGQQQHRVQQHCQQGRRHLQRRFRRGADGQQKCLQRQQS